MDDGNPLGTPEAELPGGGRVAVPRAQAPGARRPRQPGHRHRDDAVDASRPRSTRSSARSGSSSPAPTRPARRLAARRGPDGDVRLVRHGRATGGWDADVDPVSTSSAWPRPPPSPTCSDRSATAPPPLVTSPMRRCRETAAPLAARWGVTPRRAARHRDPVAEGAVRRRVPWLRQAMTGTWSDLGPRYTAYRDAVAGVRRRAARRHRDHVALHRHQRGHRRLHRRRPARHPQPRQHVGDGRRDVAAAGWSSSAGPRGRHPHPLTHRARQRHPGLARHGRHRAHRHERGGRAVGARRPRCRGCAAGRCGSSSASPRRRRSSRRSPGPC